MSHTQIPTEYFPKKMTSVNFLTKSEIIKQNYQYHQFELTSAINVTFLNCDFSNTRIKDSYFRKCKFIHCNFTGSKISDSSFRNSTFDNCNIQFMQIKNTLIDLKELVINFPNETGITLELIQSLKKNYEGIGDRKILKEIIKLEIFFTREEHSEKLKSIFIKDDYYHDKNDTFDKKFKVIGNYLHFHFNRLWGHGEFATPLFILLISTFIFSAIVLSLKANTPYNFFSYLKLSFKYFLGLNKTDYTSIESTNLKYLIPSVKIFTITFAISIFSRRHSWR